MAIDPVNAAGRLQSSLIALKQAAESEAAVVELVEAARGEAERAQPAQGGQQPSGRHLLDIIV